MKCHSGSNPKGGLDLATRDGLSRGGESGQAFLADNPAAGLLLQTVRHDIEPHMPYKAAKLPAAMIETLSEWMKSGASYPRSLSVTSDVRNANGFKLTEADRGHWAFQPIRPVSPQAVRSLTSEFENPIDQFVAAKLEENGLSNSARIGKLTLIRRLTLDLVGLPPTPEEIDEFLADDSPCCHERLIDRLLASPHYGERWGRHWLDLARYAETDGFEHDAVRPHSWRYRDYVIKSFNDDKPYDRFIREQLAGDELWPDDPESVTATGFNLLGPDMVDSSDQIQRRHNTLNDMTDTASLVFLGLTIGCARCHDHKFEPLSQRDYYALQAFFASAKFEHEKPIPTPQVQAAHEKAVREFNQHPKKQELAALEAPVRKQLIERKVAGLSVEAQAAHKVPADQRTSEQANLVLETADKVKVSDKELIEALDVEAKREYTRLREEVKKLPQPAPLPKAMALSASDRGPAETFILHRGEYNQPGDKVVAGFPEVMKRPSTESSDENRSDTSHSKKETREEADCDHCPNVPSVNGAVAPSKPPEADRFCRAELAMWVASPQNPLTSRVMINRIWQHHFGRGLVATPSDFGTHGQTPTHPELIEWLANEFCARGWSIKQMHRLILASSTYRQISVLGSASMPLMSDRERWMQAAKIDPDNRLFWRMNRLRLEGEAIRDSLLAVSGELNSTMGGPGVFPPIPRELFAGSKGWSVSESADDHRRRSVYIFARRNLRFPFLEVFDAPDNNLSCPIREGSTTAPQSLTLLNAEEVTTAAKTLAIRIGSQANSVNGQIELAFRMTLGRDAKPNELLLARQFLAESPLSEFCRAMFNVNEFVYVE